MPRGRKNLQHPETRRLLKAAVVIAFLLALNIFPLGNVQAQPAASAPAAEPAIDFEAFTEHYYEKPNPDLIAPTIQFLSDKSILTQHPNAAPPLMGLFGEIFAANPDRIAEWTALAARQPEEVRSMLTQAFAYAHNPVESQKKLTRSPSTNDFYWGAFFGSGNVALLNRLIEQLNGIDQLTDPIEYATAASAKWSLCSNSATHPAVRQALEAARAQATGPLRQELEDVLTRTSEELRQETVEGLRARKPKA